MFNILSVNFYNYSLSFYLAVASLIYKYNYFIVIKASLYTVRKIDAYADCYGLMLIINVNYNINIIEIHPKISIIIILVDDNKIIIDIY